MAYEADEAIWRPGRIHTGASDVEAEVAAAFAAVANNAVRESDLSARAALHPQNFAQGASLGAPTWNAHRVTVPTVVQTTVRVGGEVDAGMLRRPLTRFWARVVGVGALNDLDFELREVTQAGADNAVALLSFNPALTSNATVAVAGVTIARRSRLYVRVYGNVSTLVRHITCGARLRHYWTN